MDEPAFAHRDQRTPLIICGVLISGLGLLCFLLVALMVLGMLTQASGRHAVPMASILPGVIFYGVIGVVNLILGLGSMLCKRWARSLIILVCCFWLFAGVVGAISLGIVMPSLQTSLPGSDTGDPSAAAISRMAMVFGLGFILVFFILIPGIFAWFYSRLSVRLTCEQYNPGRSWTDACPLPVLGLACLSFFVGFSMLATPVFQGMMPVFGMLLRGWPAVLTGVLLGGAFFAAGWLLYRMKIAGWWIALIGPLLLAISSMATFTRERLLEMYRQMDIPESTLRMIEQSPMLQNHWMLGMIGAYLAVYISFLLFVRRYFRTSPL